MHFWFMNHFIYKVIMAKKLQIAWPFFLLLLLFFMGLFGIEIQSTEM